MPNFNVFNYESSNLKTQIFGSETNTALKTDSEGMLEIRSISDNVNVINNTADNLKTQIYGSDTTSAVKTDAEGALYIRSISDIVNISGTVTAITSQGFNEVNNLAVLTDDNFTPLESQDLSLLDEYSFAVYNRIEGNSVDIMVEISPNNIDWFTDISSQTIAAGSMDVFVPSRWLRYSRIQYKSTTPGQAATIDVYFQFQT
jgi:hypothetical protein